jgi:toxin ParE1/3/4
MPRVYRRPAARRDLVEHYVHLAENAGEETADRFLRQADVTFAVLAEQPEIGVALTLRAPQLAGLRKWRVQDFDKFLIFYLLRPDGASIVRVMHAAQDWWARLGII